MMKKLLKKIFFFFKALPLKRKGIIIGPNVSFRNTIFLGNNRVYYDTKVDNSIIGKFSYIGWNSILFNVEIGAFCSLAPCVEIILGTHPVHFVSTHPIFYSTRKQCGTNFVTENKYEDFNLIGDAKRSVIIGNDVWIGYGAKIIEGITIADGAVVLAGSMVTKNVEAYSIVGGIPAKHIKYRFDKEDREQLLDFKWWNKDIEWIKKNLDIFRSSEKFLTLIKEDEIHD